MAAKAALTPAGRSASRRDALPELRDDIIASIDTMIEPRSGLDLSYEEGDGFSMFGLAAIKSHHEYTFNHMVTVRSLSDSPSTVRQ